MKREKDEELWLNIRSYGLLELAAVRDFEDVVAALVPVVAGAAGRACSRPTAVRVGGLPALPARCQAVARGGQALSSRFMSRRAAAGDRRPVSHRLPHS